MRTGNNFVSAFRSGVDVSTSTKLGTLPIPSSIEVIAGLANSGLGCPEAESRSRFPIVRMEGLVEFELCFHCDETRTYNLLYRIPNIDHSVPEELEVSVTCC